MTIGRMLVHGRRSWLGEGGRGKTVETVGGRERFGVTRLKPGANESGTLKPGANETGTGANESRAVLKDATQTPRPASVTLELIHTL